jgi:hypothetical protein
MLVGLAYEERCPHCLAVNGSRRQCKGYCESPVLNDYQRYLHARCDAHVMAWLMKHL